MELINTPPPPKKKYSEPSTATIGVTVEALFTLVD